METFLGIMIPFLGTTLGAACVFFMKKSLGDLVQRSLAGFAAGVMVAASIWSLLIPAIEQSEDMGKLSFLPAFIGFWVGVLFLLLLDRLIPHLHVGSEQAEGPKSKLGRTTMMMLAVTLHNIPEGMAVGVVYAGFLSGNTQITAASALALSLGIAIQNFPEGAIISMPLRAEGERKGRAFLGGVLVFDAANRTAVKMIAKTWLKSAKIKNVGAYFAVSDAKSELPPWDSRLKVTSRGYMLGYNDLRDSSVSGFFRFLAKVGDGMMKMQIVKINF